MSRQLRATIQVTNPENCPLTEIKSAIDGDIQVLSQVIDQDGRIIELVASECDLRTTDTRVTQLFSFDSTTVFRLEHESDECPCRQLALSGFPIETRRATDDGIRLTVYPASTDELKSIIKILKTSSESVGLMKLIHDSDSDKQQTIRTVNLSKFTDRQIEALRTAARMGYFTHPKQVSGTEVANELDIVPSTFHKHLTAAQVKLVQSLFPELDH